MGRLGIAIGATLLAGASLVGCSKKADTPTPAHEPTGTLSETRLPATSQSTHIATIEDIVRDRVAKLRGVATESLEVKVSPHNYDSDYLPFQNYQSGIYLRAEVTGSSNKYFFSRSGEYIAIVEKLGQNYFRAQEQSESGWTYFTYLDNGRGGIVRSHYSTSGPDGSEERNYDSPRVYLVDSNGVHDLKLSYTGTYGGDSQHCLYPGDIPDPRVKAGKIVFLVDLETIGPDKKPATQSGRLFKVHPGTGADPHEYDREDIAVIFRDGKLERNRSLYEFSGYMADDSLAAIRTFSSLPAKLRR